ncbi:MAG TPA: serine/threonine-protein kinase, partial [Thermomicrobiales bacterium]|nr:serine/threonine-protein kinase [Thermomicrobiales bacterium]
MHDDAGSDLIGQQFGNYRIIEPIGSGGMGRVYRAQHLHLDREVAVKLLHAHMATDATFRVRFLREARAASLLVHPHVVQLYDYGEQGERLYLILELLTGGSVRDFLRDRHDPDSPASQVVGLDLLRQAAEGLSYAHRQGMVHRDVKPDNLLLTDETETGGAARLIVKVGDFGLARMADAAQFTASGVAVGTPAYMSPEQCQGRDIDHRSDIYSLGIVLYEFAAGRTPFTAKSLSE